MNLTPVSIQSLYLKSQTQNPVVQFQGSSDAPDSVETGRQYSAKPRRRVMGPVRLLTTKSLRPFGFKVVVDPEAETRLKDLQRSGKKLILVPNHVCMLDFVAALKLSHETKVKSLAMGAVETFRSNAIVAYILRRLGTFSVDRQKGGDDSIVQAAHHLSQDDYNAFTLFGEGRISYNGRDIDPEALKTGPARIACEVTKGGHEALLLPVSLYYHHDSDRTAIRIARELPELEALVNQHPLAKKLPKVLDGSHRAENRLAALADWLIAERSARYQVELPNSGTQFEKMSSLRLGILDKLEQAYGIQNSVNRTVYSRLSSLERDIKTFPDLQGSKNREERKKARNAVNDLKVLFDYRPHSFDFNNPDSMLETMMKLFRNITENKLSSKRYLPFLKDCTVYVGLGNAIDANRFFSNLGRDPEAKDFKDLTLRLGDEIQKSLEATGSKLAKARRTR